MTIRALPAAPALAALLLLALSGCSNERRQMRAALSGKPPVIAGTLEGDWLVADLNGGGAPGPGVTLKFDPGDADTSVVSGSSGCNRFQARWQQQAARLTLTMGASTMMACAPAAMDIERRFLALLPAVTSVTYTEAGEAILAAPDGRRLQLTRPPAPPQP